MWPFAKKTADEAVYKITGDEAALVRFSGKDETFVVPDTYESVPVTEIAAGAFRACARLSAVYAGKNIRRIGKKAFAGCAENLSLVLRETVERADGALTGVRYVYFEEGGQLTLVSYAGQERNIALADECFSLPVTAIGEKVFYMFAYLEGVRLPRALEQIGDMCFEGCEGLESIDFPETLLALGKRCFCQAGLRDVRFPAGMVSVGDYAFFSCENLKKAVFLGENTMINEGAFAKSAVESVVLPKNLCELQTELFSGAKRLKSLALPEALEAVWECALAGTGLERAALPKGMQLIGDGAFSFMPDLAEVSLPASVRSIGGGAFGFCPRLGRVISSSDRYCVKNGLLIDSGEQKLIACLAPDSPAELSVPEGIVAVGDMAFAGNEAIERLILPESVVSIGSWAFRDMKKLRCLEIRAKDVRFGDHPFLGDDIEKMVCSDSVRAAQEEMRA